MGISPCTYLAMFENKDTSPSKQVLWYKFECRKKELKASREKVPTYPPLHCNDKEFEGSDLSKKGSSSFEKSFEKSTLSMYTWIDTRLHYECTKEALIDKIRLGNSHCKYSTSQIGEDSTPSSPVLCSSFRPHLTCLQGVEMGNGKKPKES